MSHHPPVDRSEELVQLNACLLAALAGRVQVAFVSGDAGSGKTALIGEFARRAEAAYPDLLVATGTCNAQTGAALRRDFLLSAETRM